MSSYDIFGKFYDAVMGDRTVAAERLSRYIRDANPRARSVLELGCGTGSILKHLASSYDVSGVDLSSRMLAIAARKVPQAKLSAAAENLPPNSSGFLATSIAHRVGRMLLDPNPSADVEGSR